MFAISGKVLDVERVSGDDYSYLRVSMLVGKADILKVKLDPTRYDGPVPTEGDHLDVYVNVRAYLNRDGKAALAVACVTPAHERQQLVAA